MIKKLAKALIPDFILALRHQLLKRKAFVSMRRRFTEIIRYYEHLSLHELSTEKREVINFLKRNIKSDSPLQYPVSKMYDSTKINVYYDKDQQMNYVLHNNKRLYFKKKWDQSSTVKEAYNNLLIEQDLESPHRYDTQTFSVEEGDVVVDLGSAEGIFALSVIERVKRMYLFEVDQDWISALEATFKPWREKVTIINKYVSNVDSDDMVTLDTFFKSGQIDFIKADIEGAEPKLLEGASKILSRQFAPKLVLCTYHRQNDAEILEKMLSNYGFTTSYSKGYVLWHLDEFQPPYLRKCLIRAEKTAK